MAHVIETTNLTKRYGDRTVVDGLDLRIPQGAVYGFLGPNGSGKSTTMKMLLSLVQPTDGEILIQGEPMTRSTRRHQLARIGSLIESPPGYGHLTGAENMRIVQRLLGLDEEDVRRAVSTVHMHEQMNKRVREYSLGMKQRLGIAMALVRRPSLLILDEPLAGIDRASRQALADTLTSLHERGLTLITVLHEMGELADIVERAVVLVEGRISSDGPARDLSPSRHDHAQHDVVGHDRLGDCDHEHPHGSTAPSVHHAPTLTTDIPSPGAARPEERS